MRKQQRVVVIGAGVIGLAAAWRLAEAGAAVTVVEAGEPGGGTSRTSFAWLNASSKVDHVPAYFDLNALALREHAALARRSGVPSYAQFTGDIEIAAGSDGAASLVRKVERLRGRGYAAEVLPVGRFGELEPGTAMPCDGAAAFYAAEGWADVGRLVEALLGLGRAQGVTLVPNDPAQEVRLSAGRVAGVRLASGTEIPANIVVTALGRWTPAFAASLGIDVPLVAAEPAGSKAVGLLARVKPRTGAPRRLLHSPAVNWSPLADGRALLASDAGDAAVAHDRSPAAAEAAAHDLIAGAAARNPLFAGAVLEQARIGLRALPSDAVTICGWMQEVPGLYVAVTHSGVTLAPLLGQLVAREIAGGESVPILAGFRPDRFRAAA